MQNTILQLSSEIQYPKGGIYSKVVARSKTFSCTLMCLAEGTDLEEHSSPRSAIVHVIEGEGEFILEGQKIRMMPGEMIFMKASAPHALKAETPLSFLLTLFDS